MAGRPEPPLWLENFLRWLGKALEPIGRALNWIGSFFPDAAYARILLWSVIGLGAAMAWGRWRARSADQWLLDIAIFQGRRYRFVWTKRESRAPEATSSS